MTNENLKKQFKYLRELRAMKEQLLRRTHKETFAETRFKVAIPKWMHRSIIERRLFLFYAVRNYHYPKDSEVYQEFKKQVRQALLPKNLPSFDRHHKKKTEKHDSQFDKEAIESMSINEIDRCLAEVSLYVEGKESLRRKVLWEWYNKPSMDLPKHLNKQGKFVRHRNKGKINNKYGLRDLILKHPSLHFDDFITLFGHEMPTVTRASYNNARCVLRKAGYDIPVLPNGPLRPAVVTGPYGHLQRARVLNNTTTVEETDNGEAEPF